MTCATAAGARDAWVAREALSLVWLADEIALEDGLSGAKQPHVARAKTTNSLSRRRIVSRLISRQLNLKTI